MDMKMFGFYIFFIFAVDTCSSQRKDIFSTKTAYSWANNLENEVIENDLLITDYKDRRCFAVNVQAAVRHGARFPGFKDIRKMTELHEKLKLAANIDAFPFLVNWENDFPESHEKQLVDEGEDEQFGLGQRFGKRFRALFRDNVNNVRFISSSKDRAIDSAAAFFEGFSEEVIHEASDQIVYETKDDILRFHTFCKKYIKEVENNRTQMRYQKLFKQRQEFKDIAKNVKKRLGLKHMDIEPGDLKLIYFYCTFEMIILGKDDWCHLLTDEEKEVLEYGNDLKQYWKKAYGHPIIGAMACPLVRNIFKELDKAAGIVLRDEHPDNEDVATFYFGHSETLSPLYTALGLFNDSQPLLDTNFAEMKNRQFKSSQILPFSANMAIVLYKCDEKEHAGQSLEDFVVKFYVNEKQVLIPECGDFTCKFVDVRRSYSHLVDRCDFEKICAVNDHDEL